MHKPTKTRTHLSRKEEDYELIWQNGYIFHTWIERLCDRPASALGFVDIILFSTGSPNSQQPLHLYPPTRGLLNGLHLASGIWSSAGQYWVAYVWPPHRSGEGSTPGPFRMGPGPWWKACIIFPRGRGLFMSLVPVLPPRGLFAMVGGVFVEFLRLHYWSPRGKFISATSVGTSECKVSCTASLLS